MAPVTAGCDEAGCGPCFGDLVAAACVLADDHPLALRVGDSKKLTERRREEAFAEIRATCAYGIGVVTNEEIDHQGLGWARRIVFHRALEDLELRSGVVPDAIIVDGTLFDPWRGIPYQCIPRADATVPAVSAASILAKCTRDAAVLQLCDANPELEERYGLRSNKGYLAPRHVEGLRSHGFTRWHRRSYKIRGLNCSEAAPLAP